MCTHPVSKHGEDELSGQEGVQDPLDDAQVGGQRHVGLKAHVRELGLWRDVDRHVLSVSEVHRILEQDMLKRTVSLCKRFVLSMN